jgi:hypothetical protein
MQTQLRKLAAALALLCVGQVALGQSAVGHVSQMTGLIVAQRADGSIKLLAAGSAFFEGDTLATEDESFAKLEFLDDAEIILKPQTRLRVAGYSYDPAQPSRDAVDLELLAGGLKSTAGKLGKRSPGATTIRTPGGDVRAEGATFILAFQPPAAPLPATGLK